MSRKYSVRYLALFEQDIASVMDYISLALHNPSAANRLLSDVEKAILTRLENPLSFEPYPSTRRRKHPYYRIYVRNYTVLYTVINDVMEIRRFVYSRRDITDLL